MFNLNLALVGAQVDGGKFCGKTWPILLSFYIIINFPPFF
jgi:hypothetical protein